MKKLARFRADPEKVRVSIRRNGDQYLAIVESRAEHMSTELYWRTKSGERIAISEMTEKHIRNAVSMLERKYDETLDAAYSFSGDTMASYYAEGEGTEECGRILGWLNVLRGELVHRGIKL